VPLPGGSPDERRTLWLFGDSFVRAGPASGAAAPADRSGAAFVHNTIGISRCANDGFRIDYHWGDGADGGPAAFFESGRADRYWWLFDGFVLDGALYVGLLEVEPAEPRGELGLPFALVGMRLARIDEPDAPPAEWTPRLLVLSRSREAFPSAAMVLRGEHVLLFSFTTTRDGHQPRFLARLPVAALRGGDEDLEPHLETWTRDGRWTPGFLPDRARILMPDNASEMSVAPHPDHAPEARWVAVYGAPLQTGETGSGPAARSGVVFARVAPRPEGPWSARRPVHVIEEVGARGDAAGAGTICYAGKEHPAFARADELLITYVCNAVAEPGEDATSAWRRLVEDVDLYVPRVVRVPDPVSVGTPTAAEREAARY
jgi:hypothetical protein